MVTLELNVGRGALLTLTGVEMMGQSPAVQTPLSTVLMTPHSAATQHSGPMYPVIYITLMVRYLFMVNDALPTNNTATTHGTPRTRKTLNPGKLNIFQHVKITLIKYST